MTYESKPCKCGCYYIENRTYWLCKNCNHIRLHGISIREAQILKQKQKVKVFPQIKNKTLKKSVIKKKKGISDKRKEVLKKDEVVYEQVFNSKPHKCEECGDKLPSKFRDENGMVIARFQYSHVLSKGAFPEYRHRVFNFNRLCLNCHQIWEFGSRKEMNIYQKNKQTIIKNTGLDILK